jgi:hypothetical protein
VCYAAAAAAAACAADHSSGVGDVAADVRAT